ncbi:2Fe-2S iron-sulfur cluster-binding protein [Bryobacter aggregatus]|uniref:2Fe-2S iron-sulfur cluster-binding protein n=1 Tax=Bryobacter aggregatus TaxID=360054 RepID=UPI0004E180BB|nr:2Fe-2S iron-sulfur cluster-binding protein [Bryobacter aggregatus]
MPRITINGKAHDVPNGASVAAVLMNLGLSPRRSVQGEARGPVCGMGICMECRVTIDGLAHCRGCQTLTREGMKVLTDEG